MSFPEVSAALWNWTEPVQFNVVTKAVVDYQVIETPLNEIVFDGALEPLAERDLIVKPEGERQWKWWTLWTDQNLALDSIIQDESGSQYRVMRKRDWRQSDFQEYQIIEAPAPANAGQ